MMVLGIAVVVAIQMIAAMDNVVVQMVLTKLIPPIEKII